jgi:hypothetical protein
MTADFEDGMVALLKAAEAALEYLDSPNFPHKSPAGNDRKPVAALLKSSTMGVKLVDKEKDAEDRQAANDRG